MWVKKVNFSTLETNFLFLHLNSWTFSYQISFKWRNFKKYWNDENLWSSSEVIGKIIFLICKFYISNLSQTY